MKKKLNILGDLLESLQGINRRENLVRKLAEFMYENFRSAAVEVCWGVGGYLKVYSSSRLDNGFDLIITERDINQTAFSEVLANGQALVTEVQDEADDNIYLEERKAIELFASQLLILPLYEKDEINGFLSLYLLEEQDLAGLTELFQHILSLTTLVLKQCDMTKNLSQISKRGFNLYRQMRENLEDLVVQGEGDAAGERRQKLLRDCRLAAQCGTPLWLVGEEGTDKEETARYIHKLRTFNKEPFLIFDCANVPVSQQNELLFGSFVNNRKQGYLDRCHKGTLFVINAEKLIPNCQESLKDLLASGAEEGVQFIFTGALDKAEMAGDFNGDLYEMVTEVIVEVPSLRHCREDLPAIARKYTKELAAKLKLPVPKMERKFLQAILSADWKGNHQELRSFIEKALICSNDKELSIPAGFADLSGVPVVKTAESLDESIKRNIIDALRKTHGKVYGDDGAAVLLGLNPSTLQSKMRKLGIKKRGYRLI